MFVRFLSGIGIVVVVVRDVRWIVKMVVVVAVTMKTTVVVVVVVAMVAMVFVRVVGDSRRAVRPVWFGWIVTTAAQEVGHSSHCSGHSHSYSADGGDAAAAIVVQRNCCRCRRLLYHNDHQ